MDTNSARTSFGDRMEKFTFPDKEDDGTSNNWEAHDTRFMANQSDGWLNQDIDS